MDSQPPSLIPNRAETLKVLRLMGAYEPILQLSGDDDGYGTRWILDGQQIQPGIARYLLQAGFIADSGATELGARKLALTTHGNRFRDNGIVWWSSLSLLQKLKVTIFG
ncbi:MAG: hypothetical protein ACM3X0_00705 [Bacteroidota bacterium]